MSGGRTIKYTIAVINNLAIVVRPIKIRASRYYEESIMFLRENRNTFMKYISLQMAQYAVIQDLAEIEKVKSGAVVSTAGDRIVTTKSAPRVRFKNKLG